MTIRPFQKLRRPLLALAVVALGLTTTTALAGSGLGAVFNLGQTNSVNGTSTLTGATAAPQLTVKNTSTNSAATGLNLVVAAGRPPFKVSNGVKVANLNADLLDGKDSTGFYAAGSKVANADKLDGFDSTYFLPKTGKAADSDKLDGLDSTALPYWKLGGNTGTTPGTDFLGTTDDKALELKVNAQRALRLEPNAFSPNLIGANLIAGFSGNYADGAGGATISGGGQSGSPNSVANDFGTVGGGLGNLAGEIGSDPRSRSGATVAGGTFNNASGVNSTVAGGQNNMASGNWSEVAGGNGNMAGGIGSTVAGGSSNGAIGNGSTVAGGSSNGAIGTLSFAAGFKANATEDGSFVWGDATDAFVSSPAANTFTVRASGGIWLGTDSSPSIGDGHFIDTSTGAYLSSAGAWTDNSDRALKHDFRRVSPKSVLDRVGRMPISSWSYKAEKPSVRHIGPMAQDFHSAFGLGLDDRHITTIDEGGVALAAIQGLYRQNQALKRQNRTLAARLARLERAVDRLSR